MSAVVTITELGDTVTTEGEMGDEHITIETGRHKVDFAELELRMAAWVAGQNPGADVWGPYSRLPRWPSEGARTGRFAVSQPFKEFERRMTAKHDAALADVVRWPCFHTQSIQGVCVECGEQVT